MSEQTGNSGNGNGGNGAGGAALAEQYALETRAETLRYLSTDKVVRRGESDRLEVGRGDVALDMVSGAERAEVGGDLYEHVGRGETISTVRQETTIDGHMKLEAHSDTTMLGGAMQDMWIGGVCVMAGMSDDLVAAAGSRMTAGADLWLNGLTGMEEKPFTMASDGALVEIYGTLYEREYAAGHHNAGAALFSGAVVASQATGFKPLMKVAMGVRNVSPGGGGGGGEGPPAAPASPTGQVGNAAAPGETLTAAQGATNTAQSTGAIVMPTGRVFLRAPARVDTVEDMASLRHVANAEDVSEVAIARRAEDTASIVEDLATTARHGDEAGNEAIYVNIGQLADTAEDGATGQRHLGDVATPPPSGLGGSSHPTQFTEDALAILRQYDTGTPPASTVDAPLTAPRNFDIDNALAQLDDSARLLQVDQTQDVSSYIRDTRTMIGQLGESTLGSTMRAYGMDVPPGGINADNIGEVRQMFATEIAQYRAAGDTASADELSASLKTFDDKAFDLTQRTQDNIFNAAQYRTNFGGGVEGVDLNEVANWAQHKVNALSKSTDPAVNNGLEIQMYRDVAQAARQGQNPIPLLSGYGVAQYNVSEEAYQTVMRVMGDTSNVMQSQLSPTTSLTGSQLQNLAENAHAMQRASAKNMADFMGQNNLVLAHTPGMDSKYTWMSPGMAGNRAVDITTLPAEDAQKAVQDGFSMLHGPYRDTNLDSFSQTPQFQQELADAYRDYNLWSTVVRKIDGGADPVKTMADLVGRRSQEVQNQYFRWLLGTPADTPTSATGEAVAPTLLPSGAFGPTFVRPPDTSVALPPGTAQVVDAADAAGAVVQVEESRPAAEFRPPVDSHQQMRDLYRQIQESGVTLVPRKDSSGRVDYDLVNTAFAGQRALDISGMSNEELIAVYDAMRRALEQTHDLREAGVPTLVQPALAQQFLNRHLEWTEVMKAEMMGGNRGVLQVQAADVPPSASLGNAQVRPNLDINQNQLQNGQAVDVPPGGGAVGGGGAPELSLEEMVLQQPLADDLQLNPGAANPPDAPPPGAANVPPGGAANAPPQQVANPVAKPPRRRRTGQQAVAPPTLPDGGVRQGSGVDVDNARVEVFDDGGSPGAGSGAALDNGNGANGLPSQPVMDDQGARWSGPADGAPPLPPRPDARPELELPEGQIYVNIGADGRQLPPPTPRPYNPQPVRPLDPLAGAAPPPTTVPAPPPIQGAANAVTQAEDLRIERTLHRGALPSDFDSESLRQMWLEVADQFDNMQAENMEMFRQHINSAPAEFPNGEAAKAWYDRSVVLENLVTNPPDYAGQAEAYREAVRMLSLNADPRAALRLDGSVDDNIITMLGSDLEAALVRQYGYRGKADWVDAVMAREGARARVAAEDHEFMSTMRTSSTIGDTPMSPEEAERFAEWQEALVTLRRAETGGNQKRIAAAQAEVEAASAGLELVQEAGLSYDVPRQSGMSDEMVRAQEAEAAVEALRKQYENRYGELPELAPAVPPRGGDAPAPPRYSDRHLTAPAPVDTSGLPVIQQPSGKGDMVMVDGHFRDEVQSGSRFYDIPDVYDFEEWEPNLIGELSVDDMARMSPEEAARELAERRALLPPETDTEQLLASGRFRHPPPPDSPRGTLGEAIVDTTQIEGQWRSIATDPELDVTPGAILEEDLDDDLPKIWDPDAWNAEEGRYGAYVDDRSALPASSNLSQGAKNDYKWLHQEGLRRLEAGEDPRDFLRNVALNHPHEEVRQAAQKMVSQVNGVVEETLGYRAHPEWVRAVQDLETAKALGFESGIVEAERHLLEVQAGLLTPAPPVVGAGALGHRAHPEWGRAGQARGAAKAGWAGSGRVAAVRHLLEVQAGLLTPAPPVVGAPPPLPPPRGSIPGSTTQALDGARMYPSQPPPESWEALKARNAQLPEVEGVLLEGRIPELQDPSELQALTTSWRRQAQSFQQQAAGLRGREATELTRLANSLTEAAGWVEQGLDPRSSLQASLQNADSAQHAQAIRRMMSQFENVLEQSLGWRMNSTWLEELTRPSMVAPFNPASEGLYGTADDFTYLDVNYNKEIRPADPNRGTHTLPAYQTTVDYFVDPPPPGSTDKPVLRVYEIEMEEVLRGDKVMEVYMIDPVTRTKRRLWAHEYTIQIDMAFNYEGWRQLPDHVQRNEEGWTQLETAWFSMEASQTATTLPQNPRPQARPPENLDQYRQSVGDWRQHRIDQRKEHEEFHKLAVQEANAEYNAYTQGTGPRPGESPPPPSQAPQSESDRIRDTFYPGPVIPTRPDYQPPDLHNVGREAEGLGDFATPPVKTATEIANQGQTGDIWRSFTRFAQVSRTGGRGYLGYEAGGQELYEEMREEIEALFGEDGNEMWESPESMIADMEASVQVLPLVEGDDLWQIRQVEPTTETGGSEPGAVPATAPEGSEIQESAPQPSVSKSAVREVEDDPLVTDNTKALRQMLLAWGQRAGLKGEHLGRVQDALYRDLGWGMSRALEQRLRQVEFVGASAPDDDGFSLVWARNSGAYNVLRSDPLQSWEEIADLEILLRDLREKSNLKEKLLSWLLMRRHGYTHTVETPGGEERAMLWSFINRVPSPTRIST